MIRAVEQLLPHVHKWRIIFEYYPRFMYKVLDGTFGTCALAILHLHLGEFRYLLLLVRFISENYYSHVQLIYYCTSTICYHWLSIRLE